jgi:hypothetical protein
MRTILGLLFLLGACAACASPATTTRDDAGDVRDHPPLDAHDTTAASDLAADETLAFDTLPAEVSAPTDASQEASSLDVTEASVDASETDTRVDDHATDDVPGSDADDTPDADDHDDRIEARDDGIDALADAPDEVATTDASDAADDLRPLDDVTVAADVVDVPVVADAAHDAGTPEASLCPEGRTPTAEVCNGQDDDCDGMIDEGVVARVPCSRGLGPCRSEGTFECNGLDPGYCSATIAQLVSEETCNNRDDDCNGLVDDLPPTPCPGVVLGVCSTGTRTCRAGVWSACTGVITRTPEVCNGLDDDCDGAVDNGGTGPRCGSGSCSNTASVCADVACTPYRTQERCDGLDNDCDGRVDEDFPAGQPCFPWDERRAPNLGVCQGYGVWMCYPLTGSYGGVCATPYAMASRFERCNGLDDDCNGVVDDPTILGLRECFVTVDGCRRRGFERCNAMGIPTCVAEPFTRGPEVCNGEDDNCDGRTDEGGAALPSAPCTVGVGACARPGVYRCTSGSARCIAEAGLPSPEVCDGVDNNCNGAVDDIELTDCEIIHPWCRRHGQWRCAPGYGRVCTGSGRATLSDITDRVDVAEVCNGRDDDCNGLVDEIPQRGPDGGLVPCPTP